MRSNPSNAATVLDLLKKATRNLTGVELRTMNMQGTHVEPVVFNMDDYELVNQLLDELNEKLLVVRDRMQEQQARVRAPSKQVEQASFVERALEKFIK